MHGQNTAHDRCSTDPETGVASGMPEAAICVQDIDVQCVLQFTLIHAAGCALHRHTSRVIHRLELSFAFCVFRSTAERRVAPPRPSNELRTGIVSTRTPPARRRRPSESFRIATEEW